MGCIPRGAEVAALPPWGPLYFTITHGGWASGQPSLASGSGEMPFLPWWTTLKKIRRASLALEWQPHRPHVQPPSSAPYPHPSCLFTRRDRWPKTVLTQWVCVCVCVLY